MRGGRDIECFAASDIGSGPSDRTFTESVRIFLTPLTQFSDTLVRRLEIRLGRAGQASHGANCVAMRFVKPARRASAQSGQRQYTEYTVFRCSRCAGIFSRSMLVTFERPLPPSPAPLGRALPVTRPSRPRTPRGVSRAYSPTSIPHCLNSGWTRCHYPDAVRRCCTTAKSPHSTTAWSRALRCVLRPTDCVVATWRADGHPDHDATGAGGTDPLTLAGPSPDLPDQRSGPHQTDRRSQRQWDHRTRQSGAPGTCERGSQADQVATKGGGHQHQVSSGGPFLGCLCPSGGRKRRPVGRRRNQYAVMSGARCDARKALWRYHFVATSNGACNPTLFATIHL